MSHCRRTAYGWQFYVRIKGKLVTEHFRPRELRNGREPTEREVEDWVGKQRAIASGAVTATTPDDGPTFAQDVQTYLTQITTMPTFRWRADDLALWTAVFGPRPRSEITSVMIRAQLERWRAAGYAASTVNHRRTAIMHLWTVLDGKSAQNPARDVPRYADDSQDAPPRDLSQAAADLIMGCLRPSPTRARLDLYRWTGWDPATMKRLTPADIHWTVAVHVPRRKKGRGSKREWLPLLPQAWTALEEFQRLDCWGAFSTSSVRTRFRHAARQARRLLAQGYAARTIDRATARRLRAELLNVTPKQLRHTFGTLVAGATADERAAQTLLQHADIRQTRRYTERTADPRAAAALRAVTAHLATLATKRGEKAGKPGKRGTREAAVSGGKRRI